MTINRYKIVDGTVCIELRLKVVKQLFDMRDPAPFRERDLDGEAAAYILSAVREFPLDKPARLVIYFSEETKADIERDSIIAAIHNHFAYEEELTRRKLYETLKEGQISFLIGLFFLAACESIAYLFFSGGDSFLSRVAGEGLGIIGYVAMWRPIEIFLYSWWPIVRTRRYLSKFSKIPIVIIPEK